MARNEKNTRMCAGCRKRQNRSALVRVCKSKDGSFCINIFPSHTEGRGVYVCPDQKCIENALKRKSFSRSFKCELPSSIAQDLSDFAKSRSLE